MSDENQPQTNSQVFEIRKLYLKDVSLEAPGSPQVFTQEWKPEMDVQLSSESRKLDDQNYEVVLTVTVTARSGEKTAYLVEVKQGGVFGLQGYAIDALGHILGSYCPNVLFAFAREAVADLVSKGGYPQLLLNPVNFDLLYAEHQKQVKQPQNNEVGETSTTQH